MLFSLLLEKEYTRTVDKIIVSLIRLRRVYVSSKELVRLLSKGQHLDQMMTNLASNQIVSFAVSRLWLETREKLLM